MSIGVPHAVRQSKQRSPARQTNTLSLQVTKVYPIWPTGIFIQWILKDPTNSGGYNFQVYRSGGPQGPWEHIGVSLFDTYFFFDGNFSANAETGTPDLLSMNRQIYYKVLVDNGAGQTAEFIQQFEPWLDRRRAGIHRKLVRDAYVSLRVGNGTEVALLKKKQWGEKCDCTSSSGQVIISHCKKCFGTSYVGGYWNPEYTYANRSSQPVTTARAVQGDKDIKKTRLITTRIPQLAPKDLVVFIRSNRRYRVEEVNPSQVHQVDIHQELVVSELDPSSAEYGMHLDPWKDPCWWRPQNG